jgi:biotin carboxyl carrier protein
VSLSALATLIACGGSERSNRPWDELPRLIVAISAQAESTIVRDTVAALPAPEIRFQALIEADPNHMIPVTAPSTGVLARVRPGGPVTAGDTLAVIGPDSNTQGRLYPVLSRRPGTWRAGVRAGQQVWKGDTLGLFNDNSRWLAVGSVSDYEAQFIDWGDESWVGLDKDGQALRPGFIERIQGPNRQGFSADVSVDFRAPRGPLESGRSATVIVRPNDPEDSVAGVPKAAVVQLPLGSAVFVRLDPGLYETLWLMPGLASRGMIVVRRGLRPRTLVVTQGLAALVAAARDSLKKGAHKRRG